MSSVMTGPELSGEELLALLELPTFPVLLDDWEEELPELSDDEDTPLSAGATTTTAGQKRSRADEDDWVADLDFVDVPCPPVKKQTFVDDDDLRLEDFLNNAPRHFEEDDDFRLALDLISSSP